MQDILPGIMPCADMAFADCRRGGGSGFLASVRIYRNQEI